MKDLKRLLDQNRAWAENISASDPDFFPTLAKQQSPRFLWIGCSDSRVPANQLVGLVPGEMFVHRNVANVVDHTDFNCLSVMQYAIDVLKVDHIIVCGHHSCGGVKAAMDNLQLGLIDNWLRHVQDVLHEHEELLAKVRDENERLNRLCELNVIEQVLNVGRTTIVQSAWQRGQELVVHGWIYGLENGLLRDLNVSIDNAEGLADVYRGAISNAI
ncbi:MAG TPA: carbonate dehydratase [Pyrinomonadaceae bacterium]|jgi:carbonic anhydrase|nr:carbonate dehydratase [Pyrinomonadaceae bacterium]